MMLTDPKNYRPIQRINNNYVELFCKAGGEEACDEWMCCSLVLV